MKIALIYSLTCIITNKVYIGFTTQKSKARLRGHTAEAKKAKGTSKLHNAIKKYGIENFILEELYCSKDINDTFLIMENYFINIYDTYKNGYNTSLGGEGSIGNSHNAGTREKLRLANLGKKLSAETKEKVRQGNLGKRYSEETKAKIKKIQNNRSPETLLKMKLSAIKRAQEGRCNLSKKAA